MLKISGLGLGVVFVPGAGRQARNHSLTEPSDEILWQTMRPLMMGKGRLKQWPSFEGSCLQKQKPSRGDGNEEIDCNIEPGHTAAAKEPKMSTGGHHWPGNSIAEGQRQSSWAKHG